MSNYKENPNSEFRGISWAETSRNDRRYLVGTEISLSPQNEKNKKISYLVWSIDDTSYKVDGTNRFVSRYTIKLMSKSGEVFDYYEIVDGTNITLMRNHENYGVI